MGKEYQLMMLLPTDLTDTIFRSVKHKMCVGEVFFDLA
jgi:hypothetical protein